MTYHSYTSSSRGAFLKHLTFTIWSLLIHSNNFYGISDEKGLNKKRPFFRLLQTRCLLKKCLKNATQDIFVRKMRDACITFHKFIIAINRTVKPPIVRRLMQGTFLFRPANGYPQIYKGWKNARSVTYASTKIYSDWIQLTIWTQANLR